MFALLLSVCHDTEPDPRTNWISDKLRRAFISFLSDPYSVQKTGKHMSNDAQRILLRFVLNMNTVGVN